MNKIWRLFFAFSLVGIAILQILLHHFMPVMLPGWPAWLNSNAAYVWVGSVLLIGVSIDIISGYKARSVAVYMAVVFLLMLVGFHIPFQLQAPEQFLGSWGNAFKLLAYAGGALIVTSSLPKTGTESSLTAILEKLIPIGRYLFCIMLVIFGYEHFKYSQFVFALVPNWIPWHPFWTYFAGVALIGLGIAIAFNIKTRLVANLLGIMLFLWLVTLHIPRAFAANFTADQGNEWASVFECLGFSGIAFLIGSRAKK